MGKASKWFRSILGLKKPNPQSTTKEKHHQQQQQQHQQQRRWSFVKSYREKDRIPVTKHTPSTFFGRQNTNTNTSTSVCTSNSCTKELVVEEEEEEEEEEDSNRHAIAVAAATAAVAEAAVVAAEAAAAVVRLTSSGRCGNNSMAYVSSGYCGAREEFAAVKIQSAFRGYLVG